MIWMDVDAALAEVPVNTVPLTDDGDFKTIEDAVAYNATGLELIWHFVTTGGAYSATVVTPTEDGDYDWAHQDGGMYTIEIPASGGASINNDTEGFGWFTGKATGVLPWRGPTIGFRAAGLNNLLIDSADLDNRMPSSAAITRMNQLFSSARLVTVDDATFSPTATAFETDQTTDNAEQWREQVLFGLDGDNTGVTVPVTGYEFANSKVKLTVETLPAAPGDGDRFLVMGRIEQ